MGLKTTYIERENSNARVYELVNVELRREKWRKPFLKASERIWKASCALLGDVLRRPADDPIRQVVVRETNDLTDAGGIVLNLPPICRVGRPRVNWLLRVYKGDEGAFAKLDHTNGQHLTLMENCG